MANHQSDCDFSTNSDDDELEYHRLLEAYELDDSLENLRAVQSYGLRKRASISVSVPVPTSKNENLMDVMEVNVKKSSETDSGSNRDDDDHVDEDDDCDANKHIGKGTIVSPQKDKAVNGGRNQHSENYPAAKRLHFEQDNVPPTHHETISSSRDEDYIAPTQQNAASDVGNQLSAGYEAAEILSTQYGNGDDFRPFPLSGRGLQLIDLLRAFVKMTFLNKKRRSLAIDIRDHLKRCSNEIMMQSCSKLAGVLQCQILVN